MIHSEGEGDSYSYSYQKKQTHTPVEVDSMDVRACRASSSSPEGSAAMISGLLLQWSPRENRKGGHHSGLVGIRIRG